VQSPLSFDVVACRSISKLFNFSPLFSTSTSLPIYYLQEEAGTPTISSKLHPRCCILVQGLLSARNAHRTGHGGPRMMFSSAGAFTWSPIMGS
jgi:hypothetical protein